MQAMSRAYPVEQGVAASLRERLLAFSIIMTTFVAILYLRLFNPATPGTSYFPSCPFHTLTGLHCPGCGTLRGLHQLTHGHLITALDYNPLMVLSLPFIGYTFASYTLVALRGRGLPKFFIKPVLIKVLLWSVLAFWILRNVPVYPLTILAP
jgi:hypothetical protein